MLLLVYTVQAMPVSKMIEDITLKNIRQQSSRAVFKQPNSPK